MSSILFHCVSYQYHADFNTSLKCGMVTHLALLLLFRTVLVIWGYCKAIQILGFFSYFYGECCRDFEWNCIGSVNFGHFYNTNYTNPSSSVFLKIFLQRFKLSLKSAFTSLVRLILRYFIYLSTYLFKCIINDSVQVANKHF